MDTKEQVVTDRAPRPTLGAPYSQAVTLGNLVFVSGQLPVSPDTGELVGADATAQTEQVLNNLAAVLEAAGSGLGNILKTTVYLRSRDDWPAMNEVYRARIPGVPPARTAVEVGRMGFDARVEIDAIAFRDPD
ncbi:MAG TPA: Rid family detoxifying hydrolase [Solirubrobacteraceae bacterium]|nr:Rid family detoxifying hydrolase [Solirubrobacteraceae bacterium]